MKVYVFLADGFEESEAIVLIDLFRRVELKTFLVDCDQASASGFVRSARDIVIKTDLPLKAVKTTDLQATDLIFLPGGQPGTKNLLANEGIHSLLKAHEAQKGLIAAICAAPLILDHLGFLVERQATCHFSVKDQMTNTKTLTQEKVIFDRAIFTSRGMGTSLDLGFRLISHLLGDEKREQIQRAIAF